MSVSTGTSVSDSGRNELLSTRKIRELTRAAMPPDDISNLVSDTPLDRDHPETGRSVLAGQKDAKAYVCRNGVTQRGTVKT